MSSKDFQHLRVDELPKTILKPSFHSEKDHDKYELYNERLKIMYRTPASQQYAQIHTAAAAFGFKPPYLTGQAVPVCPCCLLQVNTQQLSLDCATTPTLQNDNLLQGFYLPTGVSLYFTFLKFTIFYIFVVFLTSSIFALSMSSINDEYCSLTDSECGSSKFIIYSPAKQGIKNHIQFLSISDYLNAIMVVLSIIFFRFYRKFQRQIHIALKYNNERQDDFTIIVKNIPHIIHSSDNYNIHFEYEQTLKKLFEVKIQDFLNSNQEETSGLRQRLSLLQVFQDGVIDHNKLDPSQLDIVKSISLCFDLSDLHKISKFRDDLVSELPSIVAEDNNMRGSMLNPNNKLTVINQQYLELCKSFCMERNLNWTLTRFLGIAFVSFQFMHYKNYILELYQSKPQEFKINNQQLYLSSAPKPEDIEWFNLQVEKTEKITSMLISYLAVFFIVIVEFFLVDSLKNQQFPLHGRQSGPFHRTTRTISFWEHILISAIISLVNFILRKTIEYLAYNQKHSTKTKRSKSMLKRYIFSHLINTTIIYFVLSLLQDEVYLRDDGLVVDTSYFVIIMGGILTLSNLLNLQQRLELLARRIIYGAVKRQKEVQINYNKRQQLPQFDFQARYNFYLYFTYFALFFSYVNPLIVASTIVLFFINFWVDKYHLITNSSMTHELNFQFSHLVLQLLEPSVLFFAGGNMYYSYKIQGTVNGINIVAIVIAFLYVVATTAVPRRLERIFCKAQRNLEDDSYSNCIRSGKFQRTYWLTNPATMFTDQPDINRKGKIIDYNFAYRIAKIQDVSISRRQFTNQ